MKMSYRKVRQERRETGVRPVVINLLKASFMTVIFFLNVLAVPRRPGTATGRLSTGIFRFGKIPAISILKVCIFIIENT